MQFDGLYLGRRDGSFQRNDKSWVHQDKVTFFDRDVGMNITLVVDQGTFVLPEGTPATAVAKPGMRWATYPVEGLECPVVSINPKTPTPIATGTPEAAGIGGDGSKAKVR